MRKAKKRGIAFAMTVVTMFVSAMGTFGFKGAMQVKAETTHTLIYENATSLACPFDFSALAEEDWNTKLCFDYADVSSEGLQVEESYILQAKVTIDEETYQRISSYNEGAYFKLQYVTKLGDDWAWTQSNDVDTFEKTSFSEENGNYVAYAEGEFAIDGAKSLKSILFAMVGAGTSGQASISDVKIIGISKDEPVLEQVEPIVISDLSSQEDYKCWKEEVGYDYFHGGTTNAVAPIAYESEGQRLQVSVDYTANASSTWSEAKVSYVPVSEIDVRNYNQISVDIMYPDALDNLKMKFFSDGIINKDIMVDESNAIDIGNGMKKVTIAVGFSPSDNPLQALTIGIIGYQTAFKGNIYLDNLVIAQKNEMDNYVKITSTPGVGTEADLSKMPSTVKYTDINLHDSAKALYVYLQGIANSDQVIFGHQNDVSKSVNQSAVLGDVEDVTGSVSGIFGIDTLALAGSEAGGTDAATAMEKSVAYSKKAAEEGAIITLSTHMPNFTSDKIIKNEDGSYDFYQCNFVESKDLSNDCAKQILPGGAYNDVFNAYLDIIASYALQLQAENIPIIFRPLHENTGSWFWWGSTNAVETYKSLYRYTRDYLEMQGVHNMLYVYSPNGPLTTEEEYLTRYPGDEYVDILAFDYYDDYNTYPATSDGSFFQNLDKTCAVVASLANKKGKVAAISETGTRVMKADGSDNEGLLVKGNPISQQATGLNWYQEVSNIAKKNNMPYYLVWANFGDTNFYVPYRHDENYGHEMINEFIDFYNDNSSVFGNGTKFYENMNTIVAGATASYEESAAGYMTYPFDVDTLLSPVTLRAWVKNANLVEFVLENTDNHTEVRLQATRNSMARSASQVAQEYTAEMTQEVMQQLGSTDTATISLVADGEKLAVLGNISIGKEKSVAPPNVLENFDYYSGSNSLLDVAYSANSAAGSGSSFVLTQEQKMDGNYGGAFQYTLVTNKTEVWTGRVKSNLSNHDFSSYNGIQMWVKPDGRGQKLVIQLTDGSGEEFEVYLTEFVKGTEAKYVTIPFSSFVGKKGGSLDTKNITKFAVWCNSIIPEGHNGEWKVSSTIYFDQIEAITISENDLKNINAQGLIISDSQLGKTEKSENDSTVENAKSVNTSDTGNPEGLVVLLLGMGVIFAIVGKNVKYTIEKKHKY